MLHKEHTELESTTFIYVWNSSEFYSFKPAKKLNKVTPQQCSEIVSDIVSLVLLYANITSLQEHVNSRMHSWLEFTCSKC